MASPNDEEALAELEQRETPGFRRHWSSAEKLALIRIVKKRKNEGKSIRQACKELNINPKSYRNWIKLKPAIEKSNPTACSVHPGRTSILAPHEPELLRFIFELREQGMQVSIAMVCRKAQELCREFREKSWSAAYQSTARWVKHNGLTHRMGTHESQRPPSEMAGEAGDFMATIRPLLKGPHRNEDFVMNMDQTPIPFTFNTNPTLQLKGTKTVNIRKSMCDTKRDTLAMTVTASGRCLTPFLVFKGAAGGRIVKNEFKTYPADMFYACQVNAWMDERCMELWIDLVLKPYVATAPDGIVPILFLDSYRWRHMMASIVEKIEELGVEVVHIPGGCTGLCQPVDVGINKPFKTRVRVSWEEWMLEDTNNRLINQTRPPTWKNIADWCSDAMKIMPEQMVRNAWRHGQFAYFIPAVEPQNTAAV